MQVEDVTGLEQGDLRARVGSHVEDGTVVTVHGSNIDNRQKWRHAGGCLTRVLVQVQQITVPQCSHEGPMSITTGLVRAVSSHAGGSIPCTAAAGWGAGTSCDS